MLVVTLLRKHTLSQVAGVVPESYLASNSGMTYLQGFECVLTPM